MKTIRSLLFVICSALFPILSYGQTSVPAGPVSGTWDISGSPYMVNGEIYIDEGTTLSIEPGVDVRFTGWYKFIVNGSLLAEGTEAEQILITADDTNNRWHGIRFINATGTSVLDHCIIEYGQTDLSGSSADPDCTGGGILCFNSPAASISIINSIIRNNIAVMGGGIEIIGTYPLIDNCEIINNKAEEGAGIEAWMMSSSSTAIIKNSTIANNHAINSAGGIFAGYNSNLEILANVIKHNIAGNGAGIKISSPHAMLAMGNVIVHNTSWTSGGGVLFCPAMSFGVFKDNTIAYNHASDNGGGVFITHNCSPTFESDILYFNTTGVNIFNQVHLDGTGGAPFVNYCNVQDACEGFSGMGGPYFNCEARFLNSFDADPLFGDPENDDFSLTWEHYPEPDITRSPCIDFGKPGMTCDPDGTCNDIGASSYFQELYAPDTLLADDITGTGFSALWPYANPASGYYLDVAEDNSFTMCVLENLEVSGDTSYYIGDLDPNSTYYFRVRAYNATQTSDYTNIQEVTTTSATGITTHEAAFVKMYASNGKLNVKYDDNIEGQLWVYNLSGQLLVHQGLAPGNNVINPGVTDQIVVLRVVIDKRIYHQKLFIN